jgi:aminoglycoside phosphotransferase family enzyme/predicted kinase
MELTQLIAALSDPAAYPVPVPHVEVRQTHVSVVFLAGTHAYKVKKSVNFGFLDFSTLAKRRHFCAEEVRLNARLAPSVYLGVVPITRAADGVRVEGPGEPVEWAVKMERLPDDASLLHRLKHGDVDPATLEALARKLARFHAAAEGGQRVAAFGRFDVVAGNARENFAQAEPQAGTALSRAVLDRLRRLTEEWLDRLRPLIEDRARRGVPRDTHGDLRLDHVYLFPDRPPPADLVVIDCIEFNERFRFADPVADAAFAVMDLAFRGRRDLAAAFAAAYFAAAGDAGGPALLPFYAAYRAAVRGKVEGMKALEPEVPAAERERALATARAHWLLALGELESPGRRPCLVLTAGLPGSGKSTLARGLAEAAGFSVIRSDAVRKELAGVPPGERTPGGFNEGIYSPGWTERTYAECLRRAEGLLFEGQRVLIDAGFRTEARRRTFLDAAGRWGVPGVVLVCRTSAEEAGRRLDHRRGDVSDADRRTHGRLAEQWEEPGPATRPATRDVPTEHGPDQALRQALAVLTDDFRV